MWKNLDSNFGLTVFIVYAVSLFIAAAAVGIADINKLRFWDWSAQAWSAAFTAVVGFGLLFFGWVSLKGLKIQQELAVSGQESQQELTAIGIRSAAHLQVMTRLDAANRIIVQTEGLLEELHKSPSESPPSASDRRVHFMDNLFGIFSDAWYQCRKLKMLDDPAWERWATELVNDTLTWQFAAGYWPTYSDKCDPEFVAEIEGMRSANSN